VKNSWTAAAGLTTLALSLTGCENTARTGFNGGDRTSATPTTNVQTVVVTWQPRDKTTEFLSAWRPKN
jgi:hypothetical protein